MLYPTTFRSCRRDHERAERGCGGAAARPEFMAALRARRVALAAGNRPRSAGSTCFRIVRDSFSLLTCLVQPECVPCFGAEVDMPDVRQRLAKANDLRPLAITRVQLADRIRVEGEPNSAMAKQLGLSVE